MEKPFFEAQDSLVLLKVKHCLNLFFKYTLALLVTVFFLKILEYGYAEVNNKISESFLSFTYQGFFSDSVFFVKSLPILFVFYFILFFLIITNRGIYIATGILFSLYILIQILLVKYFFTASVPLGSDLYGYSLADIKQTVLSGTKMDLSSILILLLPISFLWFALWVFTKLNFSKFKLTIIILIAGLTLSYLDISAIPPYKNVKSEYAYNLKINKSAFFFEHSFQYFFDDEPTVDIYSSNYFESGSDTLGNVRSSFKYINPEYPFLRENNTVDVLGNFFNIDSLKRPNFIVIQVEGLGRAFSGPNAYLGSFTQFLDELGSRSLYWENFLASQGRTFASLPSILGSMPFFQNGYNNLGSRMPNAITTLSLLKHNGYTTSFLMGTDAAFDNEDIFLHKQGVDQLISRPNFKNYPAAHNISWGYQDFDLMQKTIETLGSNPKAPFINYLQTISMHTPYKVPGMSVYYNRFENQLNKLGLTEQEKNEHRAFKDQYASILYTDDAIRYFITSCSKMPYYKNTIFIITGDHRLPEIPMSTKIDRYHVPLIIFSPMLKRTASFESISSHLDLTPSIAAFLQYNYRLSVPKQVSWVGSGLDTARQFRNIHQYPLKQTISNLIDFVSGEYFLNENTLFKLSTNMAATPVQDEVKLNQLKGDFNQYKALNNSLSKSLKLIPDSLYRKYKP